MTLEIENATCPRCKLAQRHVLSRPWGKTGLPVARVRCFCVRCGIELTEKHLNWQEEQGLNGEPGFDPSLAEIRCFCVEGKTELKGKGIDWQDGIVEENWEDHPGVQGEDGIIEENWRLSDGKHGEPGIGKPLR